MHRRVRDRTARTAVLLMAAVLSACGKTTDRLIHRPTSPPPRAPPPSPRQMTETTETMTAMMIATMTETTETMTATS
jgi:hypothetical protein